MNLQQDPSLYHPVEDSVTLMSSIISKEGQQEFAKEGLVINLFLEQVPAIQVYALQLSTWKTAIYNHREGLGSFFTFSTRQFLKTRLMKRVNAECEARWNTALSDQCRKMVFCQTNKQRGKKKASLIIITFLRNISKNTYWPYLEWKVSEGAPEVFYFSLA